MYVHATLLVHISRYVRRHITGSLTKLAKLDFQGCQSCLYYRFTVTWFINTLNAELNPICHLLVLLADLTLMGPCIVSIFQYTCVSNKLQHYTFYLYQETVLHVLCGTSTHHQKRIQLYLQYLVFVTPLLLSAAIVEELEPV
jgi:hypothetical protein